MFTSEFFAAPLLSQPQSLPHEDDLVEKDFNFCKAILPM